MKTQNTERKAFTTKWLTLPLTLTVAFLSCQKAPAGTYTFQIPLAGNGDLTMIGSEFLASETCDTYFTSSPPYPQNGSSIALWDVSAQCFSMVVPEYSTFSGHWSPNPSLPLGESFWITLTGGPYTVMRPLSILPPAPTPLFPNLTANLGKYFARSGYVQTLGPPPAASYADLVGNPGGAGSQPHYRTYVWRWDVGAQDFAVPPERWRSGPGWQPLPSLSIPFPEGVLVACFHADPAPPLQSLVVAGSCPPCVDLTLTFSQPLDPVSAGDLSSYKILRGCGGGIGGSVSSVSVQWSPAPSGCGPPVVLTVQLHVCLNSEYPCNNYFLTGLTSLGGTPVTVPFTPFPCSAPANDQPGSATVLTGSGTVNGDLTCASPTIDGSVTVFPNLTADLQEKDVWYKFTPPLPGSVRIDTCTPPASCPISKTVLAVYWGIPGALVPIPNTWNNKTTPHCGGVSSNPRELTVPVHACTDYYIRVASVGSSLPGQFVLNFVYTAGIPPHLRDECTTSQPDLSPNGSTFFDNYFATDSAQVPTMHNDVWFSFVAPACASVATVDTCHVSTGFNTALAVYRGPCGTLVPVATGVACGTGSATASFPVSPGVRYRVRVGGASSTDFGCGFVHVECGLPAPGTVPSPSAQFASKRYQIFGMANPPGGGGWYWSLSAPCCMNISGHVLPGAVANPNSAYEIAVAFAQDINNTIFPAAPIAFANILSLPSPTLAYLDVHANCPLTQVVLKVGALAADCVVDNGLFVGLTPCAFNPAIYEIADPDEAAPDCNGNGQQDYLDILTGLSADVDGNGVPDECQGCVPAVIMDGPNSTIGYLGGPVTLAVQTAGTGPLSLQWRKDGTPLSGQTNATLTLTNVALDAAGTYDVTVTNDCGQATSPGAVLVVDPTPWLNFARAGANIVLWWSAEGYHLQASPALGDGASWTDLPDTSPVTLPFDAQARYFRLQGEP